MTWARAPPLHELVDMESIGRKVWAIAEGYIPPTSTGPEPQMTSHETVCILNTGDRDAKVEIECIAVV